MSLSPPALLVALVAGPGWAHAQAGAAPPRPDAVMASGAVPVDDEVALALEGFTGRVSVTGDDEPSVRFSSSLVGGGGAAPVAVFTRDRTITLRPEDAGAAPRERAVVLRVPATLDLRLHGRRGEVAVADVHGAIEIHGSGQKVLVRACSGSLDVDLDGGTLEVEHAASHVTLTLRGTTATVTGAARGVAANVTSGLLRGSGWSGTSEVVGDGSPLVLQASKGTLRVKQRGARMALTDFEGEADLQIAGGPLTALNVRGDVSITSDADVKFSESAAQWHIDSYGGSVWGKSNKALVEVRTHNAEVVLESIEGPMRIQGGGLRVRLDDVIGDVYLETQTSELQVDRVAGTVTLVTEGGNAVVRKTSGGVVGKVVGGDLSIEDSSGSINVTVERGNVSASWAAVGGAEDSGIVCPDGDVTLRLPESGSCTVAIRSRMGRVESSRERVRVLEDGTRAEGSCASAGPPEIRVDAGGTVRVLPPGRVAP